MVMYIYSKTAIAKPILYIDKRWLILLLFRLKKEKGSIQSQKASSNKTAGFCPT